jgi:flagellar hook-associated protein 2
MGSPITFSGFNSIDFTSILNAIMTAERAPMTALETQKSVLNTQGTAFTTLAGKLGALESALDTLTDTEGFSPYTVASGDETAVGVAATSGGVAGTYEVVVSELARTQVMASTTTYSSPDQAIATGGSISAALLGNPPVQIPPTALTGSMSVRQFADAINAQADSPVTASVVQAAPGQYRLVLTGRNSGTANAFTVTNNLTGGAGLAFTDTDNDGTYGNSVADLAVQASNASLTVNNVPITSTTNDVTDAVPGVTLSLLKADATKRVLVEVTQSSAAAQAELEGFVKAYNDLISFLNQQNTDAASGKSSIARDGMVRSLKAELRAALQAEYPAAGENYSRLSTAGIEFEQTGTIKVNTVRLGEALKASSTSVRTLFDSAFAEIKAQVEDYARSGGLIQNAKNRLKDQIVKIDKRLETMQLQLDLRRATLQQEFIAADTLMTQLKGQSSSLQALGGQYRLF